MIKYYCDICGDEITEGNRKPTDLTGKTTSKPGIPKCELKVILTEIDPCGDTEACVCKYCMIDAINEADDRPREASA